MKKIISLITAVIVAICIATPVTASASENVLHGIDVSNWQRGINCATIPGDFVIIKVSEGVGYTDPNWEACANAAYAAGKKIGLYHFARPEYGNNAYSEANFFSAKISGWRGRAIAVLDYEMTTNVSWARAWLDSVASSFGSNPWIYISAGAVRGANWSSISSRYGLWIAGYYYGYRNFYGYAPYNLPYGIGSWKNVAAFQYTSSGRLTGWNGNLDMNVFYGSRKTWDAYAQNKKAPSAPSHQTNLNKTNNNNQNKSNNSTTSNTSNVTSNTSNVCVMVKSGDSLSSIAARNGGSWNEWHGYRSGNPNVIYVGEVVCRSLSTTTNTNKSNNTSTSNANKSYTSNVCVMVKSGDSLSSIAARNGGSWNEWHGYRSGNPNVIYVGEVVCRSLSTTTNTNKHTNIHVVMKGETLSGIANKYGTSYNRLARINRIVNPNLIYVGQIIRIW